MVLRIFGRNGSEKSERTERNQLSVFILRVTCTKVKSLLHLVGEQTLTYYSLYGHLAGEISCSETQHVLAGRIDCSVLQQRSRACFLSNVAFCNSSRVLNL
jgi:hypothetical protein